MIRAILWAMPLALTVASSLHAQDALNELKAKIWEAELVQRNFAAGLPQGTAARRRLLRLRGQVSINPDAFV